MEPKAFETASQPVSDSSSEKVVSEEAADQTLRLIEDHGDDFGPLTPEAEEKLRRKLQWFILPLVGMMNIMLFVSCSPRSIFRFSCHPNNICR